MLVAGGRASLRSLVLSSQRCAHGGASGAREALEYCASTVRQYDYEGYLCTLALPADARGAAFALRAFNVETARVLDSVKELPLALLRLRWWRDGCASALGGGDAHSAAASAAAHPVSRALAAALPPGCAAAGPVRVALERLALAREADCALAGLPPSLEALEAYALGTQGSLLHALLHVTPGALPTAGAHAPAQCAAALHAAGRVGTASGLAALLAGTRQHLSRGRVYLPADAAAKEGVQAESLRREGGGAPARAVFALVARAAQGALAEGRAAGPHLAAPARRVLLPAVPAGIYLEALQAVGHDAFADVLARRGGVVSPLRLQGALAWAALRGRY